MAHRSSQPAIKMKRFFPWLLAIVGLLLIAFFIRQFWNNGAATYQTATVTRGPITQAVTATGTLNPVVNVQVGSQVSGNISKLFVDFNSQVKAGQVVAQIDPALFQATVTQAQGRPGQRASCARARKGERKTHTGPLRSENIFSSRSRSGDGQSSSSRSQRENQTRRAR